MLGQKDSIFALVKSEAKRKSRKIRKSESYELRSRVKRSGEPEDSNDVRRDEPDQRQFGIGLIGRVTLRELDGETAELPYIKRQLNNLTDFRPFFSYWITCVQLLVFICGVAAYGLGPLGFGLHRRTGFVLTEWAVMEQVGHVFNIQRFSAVTDHLGMAPFCPLFPEISYFGLF